MKLCCQPAYAAIDRINPDVRPYGLRHDGGNRFLAVQVWEWDNDQYDAGFVDVERRDDAFFQPVLLGRRPG